MIVGSGIDMVEIQRIQHSADRFGQRFLRRVYTAQEQAYCLRKRNAAESLAARFAAKEAGAKALGTGISRGVSWLEIEVGREPGGRPTLRFHGRAPWPAWCSKTGADTAPSAILKALTGSFSIWRVPCQAAKRYGGRN